MRLLTTLLFAVFSVFAITSFSPAKSTLKNDSSWRYLQSNVHAYQSMKDIKASYAVYTNPGEGHLVIPVNTKVKMAKWRSGFLLQLADGRNVYYEVHKSRTGMTGSEYFDKILTSNKKTNLSKLSSKDRAGIKAGKVKLGMTRKGVRIAFGYPSPHATPNITANTWVFWKNRFMKTAITFNKSGKVVAIK